VTRRVAVYGVGHFGYAMVRHLQHKAPDRIALTAYDRNDEVRRSLRDARRHPYHGAGTTVSDAVVIADHARDLLAGADTLVLAVTSQSTREVMADIARAGWDGRLTIVNTAKALDSRTGRRLSEIALEALGPLAARVTYAALAGGTIADDLMRGEPLGMTVACEETGSLPGLRALFASDTMWVETSADLAGVEYAGAMKNVVAICAGMMRGLGRSHGAVTHLISRLAREIESFCVARLGADRDTFSAGSQCWGSDLWMSCLGPTRNEALGRLLGGGATLEDATRTLASQHKTVEGVQTLRAIRALVAGHAGELPLLSIAVEIILDGAPADRLIAALMADG